LRLRFSARSSCVATRAAYGFALLIVGCLSAHFFVRYSPIFRSFFLFFQGLPFAATCAVVGLREGSIPAFLFPSFAFIECAPKKIYCAKVDKGCVIRELKVGFWRLLAIVFFHYADNQGLIFWEMEC
jgi:hypothetical protein